MFTHKFAVGLVGITAAVAGAVAMARSSTEANVSSLSKAQPLAAKCPMIDWPYGCKWRPTAESVTKHLWARKSKRGRLHASLLGKRVR
jgi:hypothetical protein